MDSEIFQIKIVLEEAKPKIWRRVLVPSNMLLSKFHKVIQIAMGWEEVHLHQFIKNQVYYTKRLPNDIFWNEMDNVDYKKMNISDLLIKENDSIRYEYDFGDSWHHAIILEKILPRNAEMKYPVCIAGQNNCPPEDCGGVWGYEELLEAIKDPENEQHKGFLEWLGEEFDPEYFNIDEVNKMMRKEKFRT